PGDGAGLQLAGRDPHAVDAARHAGLAAAVLVHEWIPPDQMDGVAPRPAILGQVSFQQADRLESVGELEAQHLIVDSDGDDLLDIVFGALHAPREAREVGHPAAEHDTFQLELFSEGATLFVEAAADSRAAHARVG